METTPKIIWQTWKTKKVEELPAKFARYSKEWRKYHPTYTYVLLDDDDLREIVRRVVPEYLEQYDNFTSTIERVDFARYALLYGYGGIYVDMDVLPLKRIDNWVSTGKIVLGCEPSEHAKEIYGRDKVLCNAVMISPPGKRFWKKLMSYIVKHYESNQSPVDTTGPMAVTRLYEKNPSLYRDIIITEPCIFYPMKGDGKISENCDISKSYTVHVWENTWTPKNMFDDVRWKNKRYWFFGLLILFFLSCLVFSIK